MIQTIIGRKIDQTQKFLENGKRVPVTLIHVVDNAVLQVKTEEKDTYNAVQLGFDVKKKATKAALGHAKKAGFEKAAAFVREVRLDGEEAPVVGESIAADAIFQPGDVVEVSGTSKGKGFAGVVKRHGFRGGPKTHGQSDRLRAPGSIGQTTTPGRVYKGKRMAGRMGSDKVTVANLTVISVDPKSKVLMVSGLVPGHKQSIVTITKTGTRKHFIELLGEKAKREAAEAVEAEKAAKLAEEEAKKAEAEAAKAAKEAPKVEEKVETAADSVSDTTETVEAPAEETKTEEKEETKKEEKK
jgi:large subunit ribosomal protein L3